MIEMLCKIPVEFGWALVGACAMLTATIVVSIVATLVKEHFAEDEEN